MQRALKLNPAVAAGINRQATAADVPGWTSVSHLALVLELEKTFGVVFDNNEIVSLGSVNGILERLAVKKSVQQSAVSDQLTDSARGAKSED